MKLELGGGIYPLGKEHGYVNIDKLASADITHDLNIVPWPLDDDSVDAIYSSHCIEHLNGYILPFNEICRICKVGALVDIRMPHPSSHLAGVWDHKHVFSPIGAINMETYFPRDHWFKPKRLKLERMHYHPSFLLGEARQELPFLAKATDESIMKFIAGTCHEVVYVYTVVQNEYYEPAVEKPAEA